MQSFASMGVLLSGGGSVIDLDGSFFVQLGIFFTAFFILKSLVFKPVLALLDAREAAMGGARADAERMERESAEKRAHFEGEMRKVREAANADRDKARMEAQKLARDLTEKARRESMARIESSKLRLAQEAEQTRAEVRGRVPELAKQVASRLLNRSVQ
jgi:F-type H+-transporting ATPase subunit b